MKKIIKLVLQIIAFVFVLGYPSKMDNQLHIFLSKKVSIKVNKSHPSYVAYDAVNIKKSIVEIAPHESSRIINLSTDTEDEVLNHFHPLSKKMVLNTIVIKKDIQVFNTQTINENFIRHTQMSEPVNPSIRVSSWDQKNWVAEFKPYFRKKIQEGSIAPNWSQSDTLKAQFQKKANIQAMANSQGKAESFITFGSAQPASGKIFEVTKTKENQTSKFADSEGAFTIGPTANRIIGGVEIKNGLPFSNEHRIEIRRYEEGGFRERGSYNLHESTYEIFPNDLKGFLLGRLLNKDGQILGEGVVRISDTVVGNKGFHQGPKIFITPKADVSGRAISSYNLEDKRYALPGVGKAYIFNGQVTKDIGKDGQIKFDNVVRNSPTNLLTETKGHFTSQQIILAGENFSTEMIPEKMGIALKQIISDLKQQNLNDPNLAIILGKVSFDSQPVSGVTIKIEGDTETETIYFNSLMLPDLKLSATSENGYYAFIVEGGEMKTIMAYKGDKYFGHANTMVSPGLTSYAEIQNTIKTENVDIKVYEPFTGLPDFSEVELQGQSEKILIEKGLGSVQLPYLGRWSFLYSNPTEKFIPAHYTYIEKSDYIYVPLISREWIAYVFSSLKISAHPSSSMIIGFVIDEDFEVDIPGLNHIKNHILYFDYSGKITSRGSQGGGFILYNMPEGIYETLVFGTQSQKMYSRIAPLKSSDLFVFTYKLDGSL